MGKKWTKEELFTIYVQNIGGHCAELAQAEKRFCASAVEGMPMVEFRIVPRVEGEVDVWDMCYLVNKDGTEETIGNRCGAIARYSRIAAEALRAWMKR